MCISYEFHEWINIWNYDFLRNDHNMWKKILAPLLLECSKNYYVQISPS